MRLERFDSEGLGISGVLPEGWAKGRPGEVTRSASPADPTALFQQGVAGWSVDDLKVALLPHLGIDVFPVRMDTRETAHLKWNLYTYEREAPEMETVQVDIALAQAGGWSYVVELVALADEYEALHEGHANHSVIAPKEEFVLDSIDEQGYRHYRFME